MKQRQLISTLMANAKQVMKPEAFAVLQAELIKYPKTDMSKKEWDQVWQRAREIYEAGGKV